MNGSGTFQAWLSLGDLGDDIEATVSWDGYRCQRRTEDDYDSMTINSVVVTLGGRPIDVSSNLMPSVMDDLESKAWEQFPTIADARAEAAEDQWDSFREERALYREVA